MDTKNNPGDFDCYGNALPDEPMFILLARDPNAPVLLDTLAQMRHMDILEGHRPQSDMKMVREAEYCASAMRNWRKANDGKWRRDPPHAPEAQTGGRK